MYSYNELEGLGFAYRRVAGARMAGRRATEPQSLGKFKIKKVFKKVAKVAKKVAPLAATFIPGVGPLVGPALQRYMQQRAAAKAAAGQEVPDYTATVPQFPQYPPGYAPTAPGGAPQVAPQFFVPPEQYGGPQYVEEERAPRAAAAPMPQWAIPAAIGAALFFALRK